MRAARGQLLIGSHAEGERTRVFAVTATSVLTNGDIKAWLHAWDPAVEGDARPGELGTSVRFKDGEIAPPWRLLDIYDSAAMIERADKAMKLAWAGGKMPGMKFAPEGLGLSALQALFTGPS